MDERTKKTISRSAWTTIVLFIIRYLVGLIDGLDFLKCDNLYDYFGFRPVLFPNNFLFSTKNILDTFLFESFSDTTGVI